MDEEEMKSEEAAKPLEDEEESKPEEHQEEHEGKEKEGYHEEKHDGEHKDEHKKESTIMEQLMPLMTMLAAQKDEGKGGLMAGGAGIWFIGLLLLLLVLGGNGGGLFGGGANSQPAENERLIYDLGSKMDNGFYNQAMAMNTGFNAQAMQTANGFCSTNENITAGRGEQAADTAKILCAIGEVNSRISLSEERIMANANNLSQEAQIRALQEKIAERDRHLDRLTLINSVSVNGVAA